MIAEVYVQYTETLISSSHSGEQYGDWSQDWDFVVESVSLTKKPDIENEVFGIEADIKVGDTVFVLHMRYDTGDTFGRAIGCGEVLWVFKDRDLAVKAKNLWEEKNNHYNHSEYSISFEADGGRMVTQSNPAAGYFENFGWVSLDPFEVI